MSYVIDDKGKFLDYSKLIRNIISNNQNLYDGNAKNMNDTEIYFTQNYMISNPNNEEVINFKFFLIEHFNKEINIEQIINAYNISDKFVHLKNQRVLDSIPFRNNLYLNSYLNKLFDTKDVFNSYLDYSNTNLYYSIFGDFENCLINEEINIFLNDFIDNNKFAYRGTKSEYKDLDYELYLYKDLSSKELFEYITEQRKQTTKLSQDQLYTAFRNKRIGNAGEIYIYNQIKNNKEAIFTSRDIGDGLGYDIYYQTLENNIEYENLGEVKTTCYNEEDDSFTISDNEYKVMINTIDENNVNYYVYRVFYDSVNNSFNHITLKLSNKTSLVSIDNDIIYELDETYDKAKLFKRKQKVLTITKP